MRNMILDFCERRDGLKRHCRLKRYVDARIINGSMWKQLEGMIVCVDPLLESGTFKSTVEARELLILPGLDNVRLRAVCKDPVPVYVYSLEDDDRPMYTTAEMNLLDLGEIFDIVNDGVEHYCPVCGYSHLAEEIRGRGGWSYEICPSCGFQFGVDDERGITYEAWREAWVEGGMKWWDDSMPQPEDWDPAKQLSALKGTGTKECVA